MRMYKNAHPKLGVVLIIGKLWNGHDRQASPRTRPTPVFPRVIEDTGVRGHAARNWIQESLHAKRQPSPIQGPDEV